jgi:general stress protein 26
MTKNAPAPKNLKFKEIFEEFFEYKKRLKVIYVASCDSGCTPNSAPKMLVDVLEPNGLYFLDYKYTQTYANILKNQKLSVAFMDDDTFTGYRLTGEALILSAGDEFEKVKHSWEKRLISYEADRILKRLTGYYSTKEGENVLPRNFVIVKLVATEGSTVKPDRVLRAVYGGDIPS